MTKPKAKERPQGFGPSQRLLRSDQFRRVMRRGQIRQTAHFKIFLRPTTGQRRLGLTVSRKVGKAVQRNALKRRIREFFRRNKEELPRAEMVVLARPGSAGLGSGQVARELASAVLEDADQ
ncbi:MAG: ribonuclease P protein component [Deltaproteobacteria bacterium]|nr:ribonuclease P protein component [Deltaproteobacteria bacterium]